MKRLVVGVVGAALVIGIAAGRGQAVELLVSGDFEVPAGSAVPGWDLLEVVHGTSNPIDAAELSGNSPIEGTRDLFLKPFAGGQAPGPNNLTDAVLSQTVPAMAGEAYTFKGQSRWEQNYPGGVTTLSANGPLGAVPSPTDTTLELAFLDAGGNVVGTPVVRDLRTEQANVNFWVEHILGGVAPAGATQARVTAAAREMVWNQGPLQAAFFDAFTFTKDSDPGTELLANAGLEEPPPTGLDNWNLVENDPGNPANDQILRTPGFANHTPGGATGVWLSAFFGEIETPVDGSFSQTAAATPGGSYTLSGWSRFEANYSGGVDNLVTEGNPPSPTETFMELAFLDASETVIGTPVTLDVKDARRAVAPTGNANDNLWYQHTLMGTAPAGAVSVRVTGGMIDGVFNTDPGQSAFFDDFSLQGPGMGGDDADFDDDGDVDGRDFLVWQRNLGTTSGATNSVGDADGDGAVDADDLAIWEGNFGTGAAVAAAGTIPEPASGALALLAVVGLAAAGRGRSPRKN
ncbi:MAG TPA: hypothetical protein VF175_04930 [Lacipirellula sp.]